MLYYLIKKGNSFASRNIYIQIWHNTEQDSISINPKLK